MMFSPPECFIIEVHLNVPIPGKALLSSLCAIWRFYTLWGANCFNSQVKLTSSLIQKKLTKPLRPLPEVIICHLTSLFYHYTTRLVTDDVINRLRNRNQLRSHLFFPRSALMPSIALFFLLNFVLDSLLNRFRNWIRKKDAVVYIFQATMLLLWPTIMQFYLQNEQLNNL